MKWKASGSRNVSEFQWSASGGKNRVEDRMNRKETFVVHIISQENATWQGQVTWLGRKETMNFRSFLELVKLMDNAMAQEDAAG